MSRALRAFLSWFIFKLQLELRRRLDSDLQTADLRERLSNDYDTRLVRMISAMSLDLHPFNVALWIGALSVAFALVKLLLSSKKHLPPGPPRLPILGNALQIPQVQTWLKLSEWAKTYGERSWCTLYSSSAVNS